MTSTVVPLRKPQRRQEPAPAPQALQAYRSLPAEAREAFSALEGRVNALRRTFAASYATETTLGQVKALCREIEAEARRVGRTV